MYITYVTFIYVYVESMFAGELVLEAEAVEDRCSSQAMDLPMYNTWHLLFFSFFFINDEFL